MKYKILNQKDSRVELFILYDDNTFTVLNLAQDTLENMLKNAYILSKNTERLQYEGEVPKDLETYEKPQSVATKLTNVDFYNLTADIYDQYGEKMNVDVEFTIDGAGARIENGKIVEDVVETDTSYFIVAKVGELEQRQERVIYAPREVEPSEIDILSKKVELLASENEAKDDLLQEIILQMYQWKG